MELERGASFGILLLSGSGRPRSEAVHAIWTAQYKCLQLLINEECGSIQASFGVKSLCPLGSKGPKPRGPTKHEKSSVIFFFFKSL